MARLIAFLTFLIWAPLAVGGSSAASAAEPPRAVAGALDLSHWDFARGGVPLAGEWRFLWGRLVSPEEAATAAEGRVIDLPRPWNGAADGIGGAGIATFALEVRLPTGAPPLALWLPYINSAYRLWINGRPAGGLSEVGTDAASESPRTLPAAVMLHEGADRAEIVLQVSNHQHSEGGPSHVLVLASRDDVLFRYRYTLGLDTFLFGAALVFGVYYLAMFLSRRGEKGYVLFAAMAGIGAARMLSLHDLPYFLWPGLPEGLFLAGEYLTMFLFLPLYVLFLNSLFPQEVSRRVGLALLGLAATLCMTVIVAEPAFYTRLRDPYLVVLIAAALYCAAGVVRAARRRREAAALVAATTVIFAITVVNDSLHYMQFVESTDLTPIGFVVFLFGHAMMLGLRTNHALAEVERLSAERAASNVRLQEKVDERTEELQKSVEELHRLATIDDLTGISNRRHLLGLVAVEFERAMRYDRPLVLLMIDADHFKRINDIFGHAVGDTVLRRLAAIFRARLRATDLVGRMGGEEFLALLPETGLEEGLRVAEDLRRQCEAAGFEYQGVVVQFTISIGVTPVIGGMPNLNDAIRLADDALYEAKYAGRNRIAIGPVRARGRGAVSRARRLLALRITPPSWRAGWHPACRGTGWWSATAARGR